MHIISLGAGVQSSTMALMAAAGEITPIPDCAIFADTGAEPRKVYEWLDWLETQLPFPVHRVSAGDLRAALLDGEQTRVSNPPLFTFPHGMLRRKCTGDYKIVPIRRQVRKLTNGKRCHQWIGISTDEAQRMKPSGVKYISHRWPLIDLGMSRNDCLAWMASRGFPTPGKSACTFCPYHDDTTWRDMKANDPESWADAVDIDRRIRNGVRGTTQKLYLHRSMKPLDQVDFRNAEDAGQLSMFNDECEGLCGN
jgi:hypothetical protein